MKNRVDINKIYYTQDFDKIELRKILRGALKEVCLNEREKKIIVSRFYYDETYRKIASDCEISHERVRQIIARIIRKLMHPLHSKKLKDFLSTPDQKA